MPQNYAKLSFMNFDLKDVICVGDTVHHVGLETSTSNGSPLSPSSDRGKGAV